MAIPEVWLSQVISARHWLRSSLISCGMLHSGRVLDTCREGTERDMSTPHPQGGFMGVLVLLEQAGALQDHCTHMHTDLFYDCFRETQSC